MIPNKARSPGDLPVFWHLPQPRVPSPRSLLEREKTAERVEADLEGDKQKDC